MSKWIISSFESLASTNDTAKEFDPYSVIHAHMQTKGRGRNNRSWQSMDGNLFCSIVLPLTNNASAYSFVAGVALAQTLAHLSPRIKWPNDVLIEGKKIAGILLEPSDDKLIIGIGVNVKNHPTENMLYQTTSLAALGDDVSALQVLDRLLENMTDVMNILDKHGFSKIRQTWMEYATGLGLPIKVRLPNMELTGIFETIADDGALILGTTEGKRTITAGDVFMIGKNNE